MRDAVAASEFDAYYVRRAGASYGPRVGARVSAYLDYLTIAAQRIAEGDLGVILEPRSEDDALGHAQAMMVRELVSVVRNADATAQLITATAAEMPRVAAELTLRASAEVSAARGGADRIDRIGAPPEREPQPISSSRRWRAPQPSRGERQCFMSRWTRAPIRLAGPRRCSRAWRRR